MAQNGLISAAAPTGSEPQDGAGQAKDEVHQRLGMAAMSIIYTKETSDKLLEMLQAGIDNPPNALAHATMSVIGAIQANLTNTDTNIVNAFAPSIIILLVDLAITAGVYNENMQEFSSAEELVSAALKEMANMHDQGGQQQMAQQPAGQQAQMMGA